MNVSDTLQSSIATDVPFGATRLQNDTEETDVQGLHTQLFQLQEELAHQKAEMAAQQWLDRSLGKFDEVLRANFDKDLQTYTEAILLELGRLLNCVQAVIYTVQDVEDADTLPTLQVAGGYACDITKLARQHYAWGEGLVGQCAKSQDKYVMEELGATVQGGLHTTLVEVPAQSLLIQPIAYNERVRGVLEVLHLRALTERELDFLNKLCNNLGASFESLLNQEKVRQMFHRSNEAYQQLAAQEEEMRQNMEELQATQEEMKRVQRALQQQSEAQQRTIENVPGVLFTFRMDTQSGHAGFSFISKRVVDVFGFQPAELENVPLLESPLKLYEEDVPSYQEKVAHSAQTMTKYQWEGRIYHKDGSLLWIHAESVPYLVDGGKVIQWDGILMDISDRRAQEAEIQTKTEELAASEEEMRQNLEELQATQEEMKRAEAELLNIKKLQEQEIARLNALHQAQLAEVEANQKAAEDALNEAQKRSAQIETQQRVMLQAMEKFKAKEAEYKARIAELETLVSATAAKPATKKS
jgi:PAS domain-containing protein